MSMYRLRTLFAGLLAGTGLLTAAPLTAQLGVVPEVIDRITLTRGDLSVTVTATGTVLPARQVPLAFEGIGVVAEVFVQAGDVVPAGTPIARLEAPELANAVAAAELALELQEIALNALLSPPRPEDLAVAEAAVAAAQAGLNAAYSAGVTNQADVAALQAELARNQLWQAQLQRDIAALPSASGSGTGFSVDLGGLLPADLAGQVDPAVVAQANAAINQALAQTFTLPDLSALTGGFSGGSAAGSLVQAELGVQVADAQAAAAASANPNAGSVAQADAALRTAQAQLDRLRNGATEADRRLAQLGVEQARLAVEQARLTLDRLLLVAPFAGTVAQINVRVGELPPQQQAAAVLVDASRLFVDLAIDETDIVRIMPGQPVTLRLDALPDTPIAGTVTRTAAAPTIVGQLVTYPVRVGLDAADQPVRIGMSATATIIVDELTAALLLPNRFIRIDRDSGRAFVVVETAPGMFSEVPVTLGRRGVTETEIVSGLTEGQLIVLLPRGTFDLFDGPPGG